MLLQHWNYFLAIEDDISRLSRYIEFSPENFKTHSLELARLLMTSTQEIDVLLKQMCASKGDPSENEREYSKFIPSIYPAMCGLNVNFMKYELSFKPFETWATKTPVWWTANNKVKHERHNEFSRASLENTLNSFCALFVVNLYYYKNSNKLSDIYPSSLQLLLDSKPTLSPTAIGLVVQYDVP